jgi:hypothetical protein
VTRASGAGLPPSAAFPPLSASSAGGRGASNSAPPDSPSSLPTGCAPDTASHKRCALSRSKRTPSGSRPSRSSELGYGSALPPSVASTEPSAAYSIFPSNPSRLRAAHASCYRERWVGGDSARPTNLARFGLCSPRRGVAPGFPLVLVPLGLWRCAVDSKAGCCLYSKLPPSRSVFALILLCFFTIFFDREIRPRIWKWCIKE